MEAEVIIQAGMYTLQCSCSLPAQGVEQVSLMLLDEGLNERIQPLPSHDIFDAVLADIHTVVCDPTLQETNTSH